MGRAANAQDKRITDIKWGNLVKNDSEACWAVNRERSASVRAAVPSRPVPGLAAAEDQPRMLERWHRGADPLWLWHLPLTRAASGDGNQAVALHVVFEVWKHRFRISVSRVFLIPGLLRTRVPLPGELQPPPGRGKESCAQDLPHALSPFGAGRRTPCQAEILSGYTLLLI